MLRFINTYNPVNHIRNTINSNAQVVSEFAPNISEQISPTNFLSKYINNTAEQNKINVVQNSQKPEYTPAGFGNFENMTVKDKYGNIIQEVKFTKEGEKITQTVKIKAVDGSSVEKVITQTGSRKTMTLNMTDKNGSSLINETRSYEKIDDDNALSVKNGEVYKISGLGGNVITVEHNGQKHVFDINKIIAAKTQNLDQSETGNFITEEQKEFLVSRIKNHPGDIILKFAEEIDSLVFMEGDGFEGWYKGYGSYPKELRNNAKRELKTCAKADSMLELHELGHAVNELNDKSGKQLTDDNFAYIRIRENEMQSFFKNCSANERKVLEKFTTGALDFGRAVAADEQFAEIFGFINNMDIENVSYRTTLLFRNMPQSSALVYGFVNG